MLGGLAIAFGGVLISTLGVVIIRDTRRVGTALASYYAMLGGLFAGKRQFRREWARRSLTRKFFGFGTIVIGLGWFAGGLWSAFHGGPS
jgi:hypothetical protein